MTDWEKFERMAFVMGEIARGRVDNGRPLGGETSRQMARHVLELIGLGWPYCRKPNPESALSPSSTEGKTR